jgi:hypothetical protein
METQQHKEIFDSVTSTTNDSCDVADENISQEEKKGKKKTRRKKKSKITGSENGYGLVHSCTVVSYVYFVKECCSSRCKYLHWLTVEIMW